MIKTVKRKMWGTVGLIAAMIVFTPLLTGIIVALTGANLYQIATILGVAVTLICGLLIFRMWQK